MSEGLSNYYPSYDDPEFYDKLINKQEFNIEDKFGFREPHQELLKNYISTATPYDNILLYNALGSGKTFTSISIAEGLKEQIHKNGKKIIVITKNKNLQINFLQELLLVEDYLSEEDREIFNKKTGLAKEKLKKEIKKTILNYYKFYTYGSLTNMILGQTDAKTGKRPENYVGKITNFNNTVIIIDEAHNVTGNDVYTAIKKVLDVSFNYRLILLTGTPISDNIKEIFEISNLLNKEADLPTRQELLKSGYIEKVDSSEGLLKGNLYKLTDEGENIITNSLRGRISYVPQNQKNFPERIDIGESLTDSIGSQKVIFCKMSKKQSEVYKLTLALDNFKEDIDNIENIEEDDKVLELGEQKGSSLFKNSSDASTFIYPDNSFGKKGFQKYFKTKEIENKDFILYNKDLKEHSAKIYNLLKNIKENDGLVFIYSNYVSYGGTSLLKIILDNNGYSKYGTPGNNEKYIALDNTLSYEQREKYRKIFNSEENKNGSRIKILIGSPLMAEGITLKNVRQIHLLEPFWNMTRIEQIIGRGIRNYSHVALPENERNVKIFKYVAISEKNVENSIDKAKYLLSEEKDRQNKKVERILKEYAIDCHFAESLPEKYDFTSKCDYIKCKINCQGKLLKIKDDTTYKTFIDVFEKDKINYTINQIENLIKQNFIWSTNDLRKTIDSRISDDVIYYVLYIHVKEKITLYDKYNRSGYIIFIKDEKENDFIMFVPTNSTEKSTMFEKYMNFKRIDNTLTLEEFIKTSQIKVEKVEKKVKSKVEKKKEKDLTEEQKEKNEEIIKDSIIYGSNYDRLGKKDEKFRIVDKRNIESSLEDQRRQLSGMVCSSYKKGDLIELAKYLQIPDEKLKGKLDKDYLCSLIQKQLQKNNNYLL